MLPDMKILAFDCAGNSCSAAVLDGEHVAARRFSAMARGQAEALMPMIEAVLAEARIDLAAIDLIGVTTGPGGFTGLRIALAAAHGLALASGIPAVGVTCFAAVAAGLPAEPDSEKAGPSLVVALESKRKELFLQSFAPTAGAPALVAPDRWASWVPAGPLLLAGDGAPRLAQALSQAPGDRPMTLAPGPGLPDAVDVARVAARSWRPGERPPPPQPLYLRAPDTTSPAAPSSPAGIAP